MTKHRTVQILVRRTRLQPFFFLANARQGVEVASSLLGLDATAWCRGLFHQPPQPHPLPRSLGFGDHQSVGMGRRGGWRSAVTVRTKFEWLTAVLSSGAKADGKGEEQRPLFE